MKETIEKAYGHIPKEIGIYEVFDFFPYRPVRFYWKSFLRKLFR